MLIASKHYLEQDRKHVRRSLRLYGDQTLHVALTCSSRRPKKIRVNESNPLSLLDFAARSYRHIIVNSSFFLGLRCAHIDILSLTHRFFGRRLEQVYTLQCTRWFQIMGIPKRCGHCLQANYLNLSKLNIKFLIKHSRSVAGKLIRIKKPPENFFISPRRDIKHQLTRPFAYASSNAHIG